MKEAIRLFAERGYDGTSIADIQRAAGLAPGSGALYKHFPSKEAVLRAGIDDFIEEARRGREIIEGLPDDPREALTALAEGILGSFARDRDLLRIVWRDLGRFPDLQERVVNERMGSTFELIGSWFEAKAIQGQLRSHDSQAVSVAVVSALVQYRIFESLLDTTPGDVPAERYLRAWTDLVLDGLLP